MDLHLRLTTLLVLMLQALNGVRLQNSTEFPQNFYRNINDTDTPTTSVGSNTLDVNTNTAKQDKMTNEAFQEVPMLNSTTPGVMENAIDSLPASTTNGAAGNPITASPDILLSSTNDTSVTSGSNSTGPWDTGLPEVSNATISSPPTTTTTTTTKGWASNGTADAPNVTVTVIPESQDYTSSTTEHIPGPPQVNSTSTSTTTITSSTSTPTSTTNTTSLNTKVKAGDSGNNTENRGFTHIDRKSRNNTNAWGAIIGTALAVGFVGFIIYILLKKKNGRQFMHRKLIEDMPSEPVLRLDNGEPLDLKFDGLAYYNPGVQGDHIQMTNFPQGHRH
ncbi:mucin-15 [Anguilla rostrata]|uniref:mucin-15 n=1 Tax=Anguilla rostrata TaxID=7938 RepID=UPI0030D223BA